MPYCHIKKLKNDNISCLKFYNIYAYTGMYIFLLINFTGHPRIIWIQNKNSY